MSLVSYRYDPPLQVGVILLLDVRKGLDPARLKEALRHRLAAIPRLRQRLINVPFGFGRPVWVDYPEFRIDDHFAVVPRAGPTDEEAVLSIAADLLTTRLPRDRPLWGRQARDRRRTRSGRAARGVPPCPCRRGRRTHSPRQPRDGVVARADSGFPRPAPPVTAIALDAVHVRQQHQGTSGTAESSRLPDYRHRPVECGDRKRDRVLHRPVLPTESGDHDRCRS
jgi:hypothetical protein